MSSAGSLNKEEQTDQPRRGLKRPALEPADHALNREACTEPEDLCQSASFPVDVVGIAHYDFHRLQPHAPGDLSSRNALRFLKSSYTDPLSGESRPCVAVRHEATGRQLGNVCASACSLLLPLLGLSHLTIVGEIVHCTSRTARCNLRINFVDDDEALYDRVFEAGGALKRLVSDGTKRARRE